MEKRAAKDNKYLFIFFFAGQDDPSAMNGVLSDGDGEDDRPGRRDGDPRRGPRRKADRGQVRGPRGSHADGAGYRAHRGRHPCFPKTV